MTTQAPPEATGLGKRSRLRGARPTRVLQARIFLAVATVAVTAHQLAPHLS